MRENFWYPNAGFMLLQQISCLSQKIHCYIKPHGSACVEGVEPFKVRILFHI